MRTYMDKKGCLKSQWFVTDASKEVLGRMSAGIARILIGKNRPGFTPHVMPDNHVIVLNASKVIFTGKKLQQKLFVHHTPYPGGLRTQKLSDLMVERPAEVVRRAVRRMLPKTRLGYRMITNLHVYPGDSHRHSAQNPKPVSFTTAKS